MTKFKLVLGASVLLFNISVTAMAEENSRDGLWIQKDEAEELRTTGKVESVCEEVKKDRHTVILNVRFIEPDGAVYIYHPTLAKDERLKIGTLDKDGALVVAPLYSEDLGETAVKITVKENILTLAYTGKIGTVEMDYSRATQDEVRRYYEAQEACRK